MESAWLIHVDTWLSMQNLYKVFIAKPLNNPRLDSRNPPQKTHGHHY